MDKKIQLHESVYRIGSEKHFELIREARALWVRGIIDVSEDDQAILETNLGHFGMYEGEAVPLDMPMVNEGNIDKIAGGIPYKVEGNKHPIEMLKGEIWFINASYRHEIENTTNGDRVALLGKFNDTTQLLRAGTRR